MIDWTLETTVVASALALVAMVGAVVLGGILLFRPRLGLYLILSLAPTQFVFIPISDFFISPADVLVLFATIGLAWRIAQGRAQTRRALQLHVFLGVMLAAYLVGFVALGQFSRTLVRIPMAIATSVLACELLTERRHIGRAIAALIIAGFVDLLYGAYFIAIGQPVHPTRFSGMMGINFSAMVILSAATMAFARFGGTSTPVKLIIPAVLMFAGLATLSKNGIIVLLAAIPVIWKVTTPVNRRLMVTAAGLLAVVALSQGAIRDRVLARVRPEVQLDGVHRTSTDVRVMILRSVWQGLAEQPLFGVGYFQFEEYSRNDPEISASTSGIGYATHNTYLEILIEGGLLAFVPFLLHFLNYGSKVGLAWEAVARRRDPLVAAALAGLIVATISAAVANVLLHYLFWSTCGVVLACLEWLRREQLEERPT